MNRRRKVTIFAVAVLAGISGLELGETLSIPGVRGFVSEAQARVGRPLTPVSYAGVARRTTRRVVRRSTVYIAALPAGCGTVVINGVRYYRCGATYYEPVGGRYVVVYVN